MRYLLPLVSKSPRFAAVIAADANEALTLGQCPGATEFVPIGVPGPRYAQDLLAKLQRFAPAIVVLGADEEALDVAAMRDAFADQGFLVNVMDRPSLERFIDKGDLGDALQQAILPHGRQIRVRTVEDARAAVRALSGPEGRVVMKRRRGRGRRGVFVVSTHPAAVHPDLPPQITLDEVGAVWRELGEMPLVCEYIEGIAWTMDLLADRGKLVLSVGRRWQAPWRFPFPGQTIKREAALERLAGDLTELFGLHGLLDVDLIQRADGSFVVLEINPRPSGSSVVSVAAGIPLYDMLANVLTGATIPAVRIPDGLRLDLDALELRQVAVQ